MLEVSLSSLGGRRGVAGRSQKVSQKRGLSSGVLLVLMVFRDVSFV